MVTETPSPARAAAKRRFPALGLLAAFGLALALSAACDRMARAEIHNDSGATIRVTVNGEPLGVEIPPGERGYHGPGVNQRLHTLEIVMEGDRPDRTVLELNTYDDDIVLYVTGPPLDVEVTKGKHPTQRDADQEE